MSRQVALFILYNREEHEVLLEYREADHLIGGEKVHWFPGGGVEEGEVAEMAAAREAKEEAGIIVQEVSEITTSAPFRHPLNWQVRAFLCTRWTGQVNAYTDKGHPLRYVPLSEILENPNFHRILDVAEALSEHLRSVEGSA